MRLIDADAVRKQIDEKRPGRSYEDAWALTVLDNAPTVDAVPVCRCKNCKHSEPWYRDKYRCFLWVETGIDVFEDGFCSYGERKGVNE